MDDMHDSFNPFVNAGKSRWVKLTNWQAAIHLTSASKLQDQHLLALGIEATTVSNKLAPQKYTHNIAMLYYNNSHLSSTLSVFNFSGMYNNNNNNNNNN